MKRFFIVMSGVFFAGCSDLDAPATAGGISTYYSVMHYDPWYYDNGYYYDDIYVVESNPEYTREQLEKRLESWRENRPENRPERPKRGDGERLRPSHPIARPDGSRVNRAPSLPSRARPVNYSRPSGFSRGMGGMRGGRRR